MAWIVQAASSRFLQGLLVVISGLGGGSFIIRSTGDPRLIFMSFPDQSNSFVKILVDVLIKKRLFDDHILVSA